MTDNTIDLNKRRKEIESQADQDAKFDHDDIIEYLRGLIEILESDDVGNAKMMYCIVHTDDNMVLHSNFVSDVDLPMMIGYVSTHKNVWEQAWMDIIYEYQE